MRIDPKSDVTDICRYGEIVPGKAHSVRITGEKPILKIKLDNDEVIECTDNHLIMLRDGSYKRADELRTGDSLMPLYRREWRNTDSDYLKVMNLLEQQTLSLVVEDGYQHIEQFVKIHIQMTK